MHPTKLYDFDGNLVNFKTPADAKEAGIETVYQNLALADDLDVPSNIFLGKEETYFNFGPFSFLNEKKMHKKSIDVLEHINEEVNRAYMVKVRLDYQKNLSLIPDHIAEERIKKLDKYIEKIRSAVMSKNKDSQTVKVIQDYLQNHTTKFEFKI